MIGWRFARNSNDGETDEGHKGNGICRFCLFIGALLDAVFGAVQRPWTHLNFQNDPDDFQFAIVPDRCGGDYRGAFTNAFYSFVYKRVLFVCLNTMEGRGASRKQVGITDSQYAWFKKTHDWPKRKL